MADGVPWDRFRELSGLAIELISSATTVDALFASLTRTAREVIGAHQAICNLRPDTDWARHVRTVSLSDRYARWRDWEATATGDGIYAWAVEVNRPIRMTQAEVEAHPRWRGFGEFAGEHPPMRGWLAAPLTAPDGRNVGLVQLSDPVAEEFTEDDLHVIEFLAAIGSAALEHRRLLTNATTAQSRLRAVNDALPGGVVVRGHDGQVTFANRWATDFLTPVGADLVGTEPGEAYQLLDRQGTPLSADRYPSSRASRGERFDADVVGVAGSDGSIRWMATSGRPVADEDGTDLGGLIVFLDTTAQIEAEQRLERSERLLREAERISGIGSWYRDLRTEEVTVSAELRRMFRIPADAPVARDVLYELIHPDDRPRLFEGTFAAFSEGIPFLETMRTAAPGAPDVVEIHAQRFLDEEGTPIGLLGAIRDLTVQREHAAQLEAAERMELVGQLAGGLAHDLNNLLTVMIGHAELLRAEAGPHQLAGLDAIATATERAGQLTRQLLEFGRRDVLQPRPVDVGVLLDGLYAMARSIVPSAIALEVRTADDALVVDIDPKKMEQVLLNLVLNARDAIGDRGTIVMRTSLDVSGPRELVRIDVVDDGPGIEPDVLARVFEPFFTTKPFGEGTGLGLATSYGIVTQSGGVLSIESTPGVGTIASVLLPRSVSAVDDADIAARPSAPPAPTATVLLAEDDDQLRPLLERVLLARGHRVLVASDGLDALEVAARAGVPLDLLVTDISMPIHNGHEVAELLRPVHPDLRVIYMSGYTGDSAVTAAIANRDVNFLSKPFSVHQLVDLVDAVLAAPDGRGQA